MPIISASDFQKRIGEFSDVARHEPVTVTRHGRPSLVLLSAEDYNRLKQIEQHATKDTANNNRIAIGGPAAE